MNCPNCHAELFKGREKWICQGCEKFFEFDDPLLNVGATIDDSLESIASRLPHPLALLLEEYASEPNPYIQLHRLCDTAEMGVRFLAAVTLMEIEQDKGLATASAGLRSTLLENLERPSFGKWVGLLRAGLTELEDREGIVFNDAVRELVARLLELIAGPGGSGGRDTAILPLRNSLMHDGRFTEEEAKRVLEEDGHRERFETFWQNTAETFGSLEMIGVTAPQEGYLLRDSPQAGNSFPTLSLLPDHDYEAGTILLRAAGKADTLTLTPLQVFAPVLARLSDGSGQTEERLSVPTAQVYSRSGDHLLQFTVLHDKVGAGDGSEALHATFDALFPLSDWRRELEVIEVEQRAESERAAFLREATQRFRFGDIVRPMMKEPFVGREADLARIIDWLDMTEQGAGVVFGHPGMGKTAVTVRLAVMLDRERKNWLCLKHIFKADDSERGSARALLRGVLLQLEAAGGQEVELAEDLSDHERLDKFRNALSDFSEEQLRQEENDTADQTRLILLLDGLDECSAADQKFLFELLTGPPIPRITWLISSRPEPEILAGLPESERVEWLFGQEGLRELNRRAVREFLLENLDRQRFDLLEEESGPDRFLDALTTEARSLPLYLHLLVQDLRAGRGDDYLTNPNRLPTDLTAYYDRLLAELSLDAAHKILPDVIALLAHAKTPLPEATLEELLKDHDLMEDREWSVTFARSLRLGHVLLRPGYVWEGESGHGLYHQSFRDYLLQNEERDGFPMAPVIRKARARIERLCREWLDLREESYGRAYALRYGPKHFIEAENWDDLIGEEETPGLLCDLRFIEAKCRAGFAYELSSDYSIASEKLPELRRERETDQEARQRCVEYANALAEYAIKTRARVKSDLPEPPKAIDLSPESDPEHELLPEEPTRANRLRRFSGFYIGSSHLIASQPNMTLSLAGNYGSSGVISEQARSILQKAGGYWLERRHENPIPPLRAACVKVLMGHTGGVTAVALSADSTQALSGSYDKTLRIWNLQNGACLQVLEGHTNGVLAMAVSADFTRALSGSKDGTLRVWDLKRGVCLEVLKGHNSEVGAVAVSADFSRALSGSSDGALRVWDLDSGGHRVIHSDRSCSVKCVAISPCGSRALSGHGISKDNDKTLCVWDLESNQLLASFKGASSYKLLNSGVKSGSRKLIQISLSEVTSVALSPDSMSFLSSGDDRTLRVWDLNKAQCVAILEGHTAGIANVSFSPDGKRAITSSFDQTLRLWDLCSGRCLNVFEGHSGSITSVATSLDCSNAISGSQDNTVHVWDLSAGKSSYTQRSWDMQSGRCNTEIVGLGLSTDGIRAVSASGEKSLFVWDMQSGRCINTLQGHTDSVNCVILAPSSLQAVSASSDNTLRTWDIGSGRCLNVLEGHTGKVKEMDLSLDGSRVLSLGDDKTLRVWDFHSGKCLATLKEEGGFNFHTRIAISPDGTRAVTGDLDTMHVWDLDKKRCVHYIKYLPPLTLSGGGSIRPYFSVEGSWAVVSGEGFSLDVWDLDTGQFLYRLSGHTGRIWNISLAPDGSHALSASRDKTLRVWDLDGRRCVHVLDGHTGEVGAIAANAKFSLGVSGSDDRTLRLWDLKGGTCLATYYAGVPITSVSADFARGRFVCGCEDGQVHVLTLRRGNEIVRMEEVKDRPPAIDD